MCSGKESCDLILINGKDFSFKILAMLKITLEVDLLKEHENLQGIVERNNPFWRFR